MLQGCKVYIKGISNTKRYIGLDADNEMNRMVKKEFTIREVGMNGRVKIKSPYSKLVYSWHIEDIVFKDLDKNKKPSKIIFEFDSNQLDI